MAIQQDILLNFQTNVEAAKSDLTQLASLYQQSLTPAGQAGAFDDTQQAQVQELIAQRAAQAGMSQEQVKATLQNIVDLQREQTDLQAKSIETAQRQTELTDRIADAEQRKRAALDEAARLLGVEAGASQEVLRAKLKELQTSQDSTMSAKEKNLLTQKLNQLLGVASTQSGRITKSYNEQERLATQQIDTQEELNSLYSKIRAELLKMAKTTEERDLIESSIVPTLITQNTSLKQNTKEREKAVAAAAKEKKETEDINRTLKATPGTFAQKAVGALLYYEALNALKRVARAAINTLRDLDRALTDIAVVTNMNREESWALLSTYQTMAKEVGLTATEVAKLSIEFFRQGREARDALELTRTAAQFAKIAAIDVKEAANFLTAAINGFNLAASDATTIIDKFAALGAGAAASAQEIAIALSKVAPAAASAGVEVDTLMAFVTKGIETTREAPENIGTAFKTIFARMRQLTDLGKTVEDGLDVNKVDNALKSIGVQLRNATGEFRDLDDVLIEVGGRWSSINRNQQAYVATTLAGTRQQTRLIALFEDFDRTLELIELSQNSAGVAALQHQEYMEGMEAATTRLQTSFQELVTSFVQADFIVGIINALNTAMELLNTTVGRTIIVLGTARLAMAAMNNTGGKLHQVVTAMSGGFTKLAKVRFSDIATSGLDKIGNLVTKNLSVGMTGASKSVGMLGGALAKLQVLFTGPLGIGLLIIGLVVAIKKIRESTNTTSPIIAKLKIIFDALARTLGKIAEAFAKVGELIAKVPALLGPIGVIGSAVLDLLITETDTAIANFRVLTNSVAEMRKELFESEKETDKLAKTLAKFQSLSQISFKNAGQLSQFEDTQRELQLILNTDLSGFDLIAEANVELLRQEKEIEQAYADMTQRINEFFESTGDISFTQALLDPDFDEDLKKQLPFFAQEYAKTLIKEFDDLAPEVQNAINRSIALDPAGFLDSMKAVRTAVEDVQGELYVLTDNNTAELVNVELAKSGETIEEAYNRIKGSVKGFNRSLEDFTNTYGYLFEDIGDVSNEFVNETIPQIATALATIQSPETMDDFVDNILALQAMDLSMLTEDQRNNLFNTFPNLASLLDLEGGEDTLRRIAEVGGMSFISAFDDIRGAVKNLGLQDIVFGGGASISGEDQEEDLSNALLDMLANPDRVAGVKEALSAIFSGAVGGVEISPEARVGFANEILDSIPRIDPAVLNNALFGFQDDAKAITEIAGKSISEWSEKDLETLRKYPDVLADIKNGEFDIAKFRKEQNESIISTIDEELAASEAILDAAEHGLDLAIANSELDAEGLSAAKERYRTALNQFENDKAYYETLKEIASTQEEITESVKDQYKAQLDLLKARRDSIAEARKVAELQQKSAEIARKSLEATRIGAVGSLEAQFNRQQINEEIAMMNKELQDRIMLAQIEAQQKILEDSQQKAIEAATKENTAALDRNTAALVETKDAIIEIPAGLAIDFGASSSVTGTPNMARDQQNALVAQQE